MPQIRLNGLQLDTVVRLSTFWGNEDKPSDSVSYVRLSRETWGLQLSIWRHGDDEAEHYVLSESGSVSRRAE